MKSGDLKPLIESRRTALVCLGLAVVTAGVYWRLWYCDFTNYDDYFMLVHNPMVSGGLSGPGILWAFSTSWFEYWHPLTWLSHMLDYELFGPSPGWQHMVNLGFHVANTVLLFAVLRRMSGALWRSAMVAALFALHPLHVESVAWLAERKDVLSAFFFILTLWAYVRYGEVQSPKSKVQSQESEVKNPTSGALATDHGRRTTDHGLWTTSPASFFYLLSLFFFVCGLMCKPMLVTLPFVLLLLDYWPLQRFQLSTLNPQLSTIPPLHHSTIPPLRLVLEKLPFFGLAFGSCAITYFGVKAAHNILSVATVPWSLRLGNVPVSYARYLGKMIWPAGLAVMYPLPSHWAWWEMGGTVLVLVLISWFVLVRARSAPYLVVGWLTFLGMLVPTIGLVPAGFQSIADRYTYLPFLGLFVAVVWGIADWSAPWRFRTALRGGTAVAALLACGYLTWGQVRHWENSVTLWTHCLAVTRDNAIAHYNLGYALQHAGQTSQAIEHYQAALRIKPDHLDANLNLGTALATLGRAAEATNYFARTLRLRPDYGKAHEDMAMALVELGDFAGAEKHGREAVRLDPENVRARFGLARALSGQGASDEALRFYAEALRLAPFEPMIHFYLGLEWSKRGQFGQAVASLEEAVRLDPASAEARTQLDRAVKVRASNQAIADYREALRVNPDSPEALNNLAWILATHPEPEFRNGAEAVQLAQRACERTDWNQTVFIGTLAAAHAEAGQFDQAVATAQRACALAAALGQTNLLTRNQELLRQYQRRQPCREPNGVPQ